MSTSIFDAIRNNDLESLKKIIETAPDAVHLKDQRGSNPLLLATYFGHFEISQFLIANGADVDLRDNSGNTALMGVSFKGPLLMAKLLIDNGANVNAVNNNGASALSFASSYKQYEIVNLLLEAGADPSLKDVKS